MNRRFRTGLFRAKTFCARWASRQLGFSLRDARLSNQRLQWARRTIRSSMPRLRLCWITPNTNHTGIYVAQEKVSSKTTALRLKSAASCGRCRCGGLLGGGEEPTQASTGGAPCQQNPRREGGAARPPSGKNHTPHKNEGKEGWEGGEKKRGGRRGGKIFEVERGGEKEKGFYNFLGSYLRGGGGGGGGAPVIAANDAYMKDNPEAVKGFLAAVKEGYEYAVSNPEMRPTFC